MYTRWEKYKILVTSLHATLTFKLAFYLSMEFAIPTKKWSINFDQLCWKAQFANANSVTIYLSSNEFIDYVCTQKFNLSLQFSILLCTNSMNDNNVFLPRKIIVMMVFNFTFHFLLSLLLIDFKILIFFSS